MTYCRRPIARGRRAKPGGPIQSMAAIGLASLLVAGDAAANEPPSVPVPQPSTPNAFKPKQTMESAPFGAMSAFIPDDDGRAVTRACSFFNADIDTADIELSDFVTVSPEADTSVSVVESDARNNRGSDPGQTVTGVRNMLCVDGLRAGETYTIELAPGLRSIEGNGIADGRTDIVTIPDRNPVLGFPSGRYVLPRLAARGLPLRTVNITAVDLTLSRVPERNLIRTAQDGDLFRNLYPYEIRRLEQQIGEKLWSGVMDIDGPRNRRITTIVPLNDLLARTAEADPAGRRGPGLETGLYVLTATMASNDRRRWSPIATQWFVVSDLGLTFHGGGAAAEVQVRSLASAKPVPGVDVTLFARNNEPLAMVETGPDGVGRFDPGLLRGEGGRAPEAITAVLANGTSGDGHDDFTFLDLTTASFDLSDRGVGGRPHPGPLDAFLYAERGVYRPGETARITALLRDDLGAAVTGLPLTLTVLAPDGTETRRAVVADAGGGGHPLTVRFPRSARTGSWTVRAHADPEGPSIGALTFLVEDIVPARVEVDLGLDRDALVPGEALMALVQGDYLYGAPAHGLKATATVTVHRDANPHPAWRGYAFGLADENVAAARTRMDLPDLDADGRTLFDLASVDIPDTPQPLKAMVRVDVFEPGGRPVIRSVAVPVRHRPFAIGIKRRFGERIPEQGTAAFDLIAIDPEGTRVSRSGLSWQIVREHWQYRWFNRHGGWDYDVSVRAEVTAAGTIDIAADSPAALSHRVDWGPYRLEVYDWESGVASSARFYGGWWVSPSQSGAPDRLAVRSDRDSYAVGDTVTLHVEAPFTGDLEVIVANDRIVSRRRIALDAGGSRINIPVDDDWGTGVYLLATAYRPGEGPSAANDPTGPAMPGRAIGVVWIPVDRPDRRLTVSIDTPDLTRPDARVILPVTVSGVEPGQGAFVTVAAVDEGVLGLTRYSTPDPQAHVLGQRQLRLDVHDLYGRLIDDRDGTLGRPRGGGDASGLASEGAPDPTIKIVSLFSGVLPVGADGAVAVPFDIPDYNGRLRVMAVAWSNAGVGSAEASLAVRPPLVAQLGMPRFLTVGDEARATVRLQNLDAPVGDYRFSFTADADGPFSVTGLRPEGTPPGDAVGSVSTRLGARGGVTLTADVRARAVGSGVLQLRVEGPDGFVLNRTWPLSTRPRSLRIHAFQVGRLEPGHAMGLARTTFEAAFGEIVPGTAEAWLRFADRPAIDVPGLIAGLDRYPYGCLEQTVSRAIPLLYFNDTASDWGVTGRVLPAVRMQSVIDRIFSLQRANGLFALWPHARDQQIPYASAYAVDFLLRARARGYPVPRTALSRSLAALRAWGDNSRDDSPLALSTRAYAAYILSRTEEGAPAAGRYLADARMDALPTPTDRAMVAAALANHGSLRRARQAFRSAFDLLEGRIDVQPVGRDVSDNWRTSRRDFGSRLRDTAAVVAIAAETENRVGALVVGDRIGAALRQAVLLYADRRWHSTQEQGWLLLAAHAIGDAAGEGVTLELSKAGQIDTVTGVREHRIALDDAGVAGGLIVRNAGAALIWRSEALSAIPAGDPGPKAAGIQLSRQIYTPEGKPLRRDRVRQTDRLVVVIVGRVTSGLGEQVLLVDPIPAGFEPENPTLRQHDTDLPDWVGAVIETEYAELRDDRFVAAFHPPGNQEFRLAYEVRAITPGAYVQPAAIAEHMYVPEQRGRTGVDSVTVIPYR